MKFSIIPLQHLFGLSLFVPDTAHATPPQFSQIVVNLKREGLGEIAIY
jgi:hypothetical protein